MNAAKILHNTAMDFYDMAKIAKAKGNLQSHNEYMEKALVIEKEAALKLPDHLADTFWPYAYLRSAAWMAFHLEQFEEAKILIQLAFKGNPSAFEKERLNEILSAIKVATASSNTISSSSAQQTLTGFLISIDLSQRQVIVQLNNKDYRHLVFPQPLQIAAYLLGHMVTVQFKEENLGELVVETIRLAA